MLKNLFIFFVLFVLSNQKSFAQDTLPRFTLKSFGNTIIVSWRTNYGIKISTINIQRSKDSLKNFTTIGSVLEPMNRENGYVDSKATNPNLFYRVFVAFEGGTYIFTKSFRPVRDSILAGTRVQGQILDAEQFPEPIPTSAPPLPSFTFKSESLKLKIKESKPPAPKPYVYVPSKSIYTNKENNLIINLTADSSSHFAIKFFDDKDFQVFEIAKVTERYLIIEKVNFLHSGWFYFKLFENGVMTEKNQFYISKEGKTGIPQSLMNKKIYK